MGGLKVYIPVAPVTRTCAFVNCAVTFVATRKDTRYCGKACRSNAAEVRNHGNVLLGTGIRGAIAVRFYRERQYVDIIKRKTQEVA